MGQSVGNLLWSLQSSQLDETVPSFSEGLGEEGGSLGVSSGGDNGSLLELFCLQDTKGNLSVQSVCTFWSHMRHSLIARYKKGEHGVHIIYKTMREQILPCANTLPSSRQPRNIGVVRWLKLEQPFGLWFHNFTCLRRTFSTTNLARSASCWAVEGGKKSSQKVWSRLVKILKQSFKLCTVSSF